MARTGGPGGGGTGSRGMRAVSPLFFINYESCFNDQVYIKRVGVE